MEPIDIREEWPREKADTLEYEKQDSTAVRESLIPAVETEIGQYDEIDGKHVPAMAEDVIYELSDAELGQVYRGAVEETDPDPDPETVSSLDFVDEVDRTAAGIAVEHYLQKQCV